MAMIVCSRLTAPLSVLFHWYGLCYDFLVALGMNGLVKYISESAQFSFFECEIYSY